MKWHTQKGRGEWMVQAWINKQDSCYFQPSVLSIPDLRSPLTSVSSKLAPDHCITFDFFVVVHTWDENAQKHQPTTCCLATVSDNLFSVYINFVEDRGGPGETSGKLLIWKKNFRFSVPAVFVDHWKSNNWKNQQNLQWKREVSMAYQELRSNTVKCCEVKSDNKVQHARANNEINK